MKRNLHSGSLLTMISQHGLQLDMRAREWFPQNVDFAYLSAEKADDFIPNF